VSGDRVRPGTGGLGSPHRGRLAAVVAALLCAAPVPGDIGACGQPVQRLDAPRFFVARKAIDCRRCQLCSLGTETCATACDGRPPVLSAFPDGCAPLVHDGEVCLRELLSASCNDYAAFVSDVGPSVPSECDFCPVER
jgi:hypothetical protein